MRNLSIPCEIDDSFTVVLFAMISLMIVAFKSRLMNLCSSQFSISPTNFLKFLDLKTFEMVESPFYLKGETNTLYINVCPAAGMNCIRRLIIKVSLRLPLPNSLSIKRKSPPSNQTPLWHHTNFLSNSWNCHIYHQQCVSLPFQTLIFSDSVIRFGRFLLSSYLFYA